MCFRLYIPPRSQKRERSTHKISFLLIFLFGREKFNEEHVPTSRSSFRRLSVSFSFFFLFRIFMEQLGISSPPAWPGAQVVSGRREGHLEEPLCTNSKTYLHTNKMRFLGAWRCPMTVVYECKGFSGSIVHKRRVTRVF